MGVPRLHRWLLDRYPICYGNLGDYPDMAVDNLYLDMNAIVHEMSHGNKEGPLLDYSNEEVFSEICKRILELCMLVKPGKVVYIAIDGVAPRAKINQQRARRFMSARDLKKYLLSSDDDCEIKVLPKNVFDPNCITPGTRFMYELDIYIKSYIQKVLINTPVLRQARVIYSGYKVPGEGEHKIMEYVRYERTKSEYDSNTRHCIYSPDADIIMLSLLTHESHFSIMREELPHPPDFVRRRNKEKPKTSLSSIGLFHTSAFRDYLDIEFSNAMSSMKFEYNLERVINDFSVLTFLLGNDFLPNLPFIMISEDHLLVFINVYKDCLSELDGYISNEKGLNLKRLCHFFKKLTRMEFGKYVESEVLPGHAIEQVMLDSMKFNSDQKRDYDNMNSIDTNELEIIRTLIMFTDPSNSVVDGGINVSVTEQTLPLLEYLVNKVNLFIINSDVCKRLIKNTHPVPRIMLIIEDSSFPLLYWYPPNINTKIMSHCKSYLDKMCSEMKFVPSHRMHYLPHKELHLHDEFEEYRNWKIKYYVSKLGFDPMKEPHKLYDMIQSYTKGLEWINHYYVTGIKDWRWYYPYHYAPFVSDLTIIDEFENGKFNSLAKPYDPLTQLTAIIPKTSCGLLPKALRTCIASPTGPLAKYYSDDFDIDPNGKKAPWEYVVRLPFIDEEILIDTVSSAMSKVTPEELKYNGIETAKVYTRADLGAKTCETPNSGKLHTPQTTIVQDLVVKQIETPSYCQLPRSSAGLWAILGFPILSNIGRITRKHVKLPSPKPPSHPKPSHRPHNAKAEPRKVMMLNIENPLCDLNSLEIVHRLLGVNKFVAIGWPYLRSAKCNFICCRQTGTVLYYEDNWQELAVHRIPWNVVNNMFSICDKIEHTYTMNHRINIGRTEYCVSVSEIPEIPKLQPIICIPPLQHWRDPRSTIYPVQLVLDNYDFSSLMPYVKRLQDLYHVGSAVYLTGSAAHGCTGSVLDLNIRSNTLDLALCGRSNPWSEGRIRKICEDLRYKQHKSMDFMSHEATARFLNISTKVLGRITSSYLVDIPYYDKKINIFLKLKSSRKGLKRFGYVHFGPNMEVEYSHKARTLILQFKKAFPELVVDKVANEDLTIEYLFHPSRMQERVSELENWLEDKGINSCKLVESEYSAINPEYTGELHDAITKNIYPNSEPSVILVSDVPYDCVRSCTDKIGYQKFEAYDRVVYLKNDNAKTTEYIGTVIEVIDKNNIMVAFDPHPSESRLENWKSNNAFMKVDCGSVINTSNRDSLQFLHFSDIHGDNSPHPAP